MKYDLKLKLLLLIVSYETHQEHSLWKQHPMGVFTNTCMSYLNSAFYSLKCRVQVRGAKFIHKCTRRKIR